MRISDWSSDVCSSDLTCLVPLLGCPSHDANELQPWYEYTREGIRSVDPHNMIWFESEPQGSSIGTPKGFGPVDGESQLGYSFHDYCPLAALTQPVPLGLLDPSSEERRVGNDGVLPCR